MKRLLVPALLLLVALPLLAAPAGAQSFKPEQREEIIRIVREALKQDPSILRDAIEALQADEGRRQQAASRAAIAAHRPTLVDPADPVAGNPQGDVTIVEFFDVRCPYCRQLEPVMEEFLRRDGKVRLVYKDLPILGPVSVLASKALLAAQKQGGYDKLREAIMRPGAELTRDGLRAQAERLGLDWARMQRDMEDPAVQQRIDRNLALAQALGVRGTPALLIGETLIPGAVDATELKQAVAEARAGK